MEFYKRFSYKPFGADADTARLDLDDSVSEKLNRKLENWSKEMTKKHKSFKYRIVNAESPILYNYKSDLGIEKVLVTAYNLDRFAARSPELGIAESLERLHRELERAEEFHKKLQGYYEVGLVRRI